MGSLLCCLRIFCGMVLFLLDLDSVHFFPSEMLPGYLIADSALFFKKM